MACPLAFERVWVDKYQYNDAEKKHYEQLSGVSHHNLINCESYASSTLLFLGLLLNTENEQEILRRKLFVAIYFDLCNRIKGHSRCVVLFLFGEYSWIVWLLVVYFCCTSLVHHCNFSWHKSLYRMQLTSPMTVWLILDMFKSSHIHSDFTGNT